ncbi:hypothetical protein [Helicobacter acinonychis]|uniref:hypothetical protein n=1 Tax=Helicobacter acinonychis TaxID=212 RepID=UPI0005A19449|nr:hypothetical protein [Helicobacter acinonychis]
MIEKIKVREGLILALYPYNRGFIGFEIIPDLDLVRLRKILLSFVGVKLVPLLGLNYSIIIKF